MDLIKWFIPKVDLTKFEVEELVSIHETCHHIIIALKTCNFRIYINIFGATFFKRVTQSFMFDFGSQVFAFLQLIVLRMRLLMLDIQF